MRFKPSKSQHSSRKEAQPNLFILFVVFPVVFFFGMYTWSYFRFAANMWVLAAIFVFIMAYAMYKDHKRRLEPGSIRLVFRDKTIFLEKFLGFIDRIGLEYYQIDDNTFKLSLKSQGQIKLAVLAFPPKAWSDFQIQISENSATIAGPKYSLNILKRMIQQQAVEEETIQLPY